MIPYLGNKSNISEFLKQYVPKNPKKWVEPFGGGFGLYFNLDLREYPDTEFIYNDINPLNCILFEQLKNPEFLLKVKSVNATKDIFESSYSNLVDSEPKKKSKKVIKVDSSEEKALSWLIILCCGDSRDLMSKEYKGNSAFEILKYKLPRYSEYFNRIQISNLDYKDVLKQQEKIRDDFKKVFPNIKDWVYQEELIPKYLKDYFIEFPEREAFFSHNKILSILVTKETIIFKNFKDEWFGKDIKIQLVDLNK